MSPAPPPPPQAPNPAHWPTLIRGVARSFALSLLWLPQGVRAPVGLAYLLARASDTVADSMDAGAQGPHRRAMRRAALEGLSASIQAAAQEPPEYLSARGPWVQDLGPWPQASERALLDRLDDLIQALMALPLGDRRRIAAVCETIVSGQRLDLLRFDHETGTCNALANRAEVLDYTWRVAGCVGHFWSETCEAHVPNWRTQDLEPMMHNGGHFGMGLQRLNLLRDTAQDLRLGRCYWPLDELACVGVTPQTLTQAVQHHDLAHLATMRPLMAQWIEQTRMDLSRGLRYALAVRPWRLRWACALPALIGLRTLQEIEQAGPQALTRPVKVSRPWVYALMLRLCLGGLRAPALKSLGARLGAHPDAQPGGADNGTMPT